MVPGTGSRGGEGEAERALDEEFHRLWIMMSPAQKLDAVRSFEKIMARENSAPSCQPAA